MKLLIVEYEGKRIDLSTINGKTPKVFGPLRAEELWAARGWQWDMSHIIKPSEYEYVKRLWKLLPGNTCWLDAFFLILHNKITFVERKQQCP